MKGLQYFILTAFLIGFTVSDTRAQGKGEKKFSGKITGKVTDGNNKALPGVVVEVQEENRRTVTGPKGTFAIKAAAGDVLIFNKKEYATLQKVVGDGVAVTITLQPTKIGGGEDDNVVIPFGERKKREINYALSQIQGKSLANVPTSNFLTLLGGAIPGLYVQQTGGGPGGDNVSLQVRGRSTYNDGNSPRVLVDGIPRDASELDVSEVESVTVLKDAAALTWYGLNAANGVVLINTKRGSSKRMSLNFTTQAGVQQRSSGIAPLNSFDYATLYNESVFNVNPAQPPLYDAAALDAYRNGTDPYRFPNNNYIETFLKESAPVQRHVLSADGGNSSFRYYTQLSYVGQDGFFKSASTNDFNSNARFQRVTFRVNLDYDVTKNLSVGLLAGARTNSQRDPLDGSNSLLGDLYNLPPNAFPILNADGSYGGTSVYQNNPLGRLQSRGYVRNLNRVLTMNVTAKQKISFIPGLSANILFSFDARGNYTSGLSKNYEVFDMTGAAPAKFRTEAPLNYIGANFNNNNRRNEIWAGLDYDRLLGGVHKLNASVRAMRSADASPERLDFRGQQLAARVDYSLKDRYFLGVVSSYAGSENFPPGKRYGFFPAVSAGWILSEEQFLKNAFRDNYMKVRASYGAMGNGDIGGGRLPYRNAFRAPAGFGYAFGTSFAATVSADQTTTGNPNITWETLKRFNVGSDFTFLKRALNLSVDYFSEERSGILTIPRIPSILGVGLARVNEGVVTSKGIDASLLFEKQVGAFVLGLNANYTYAKNNVVSVNEEAGLLDYQRTVGFNTGTVDGFSTKRLFLSQGLSSTGDIIYKDFNNDGVINNLDAVTTNHTDIPHTYYGFGLNLRYKAVQVSGQFQGTAGRTIQIHSIVNSGPKGFNALSLDRWTPANAETARFPRLTAGSTANDVVSDFWLRSGDFLKLRTLELSLSLPERFTERLRIQNTRVFVSGYNLMNFKKLDIPVDSEMPGAGYGSAYPYLKTFAAGLSVQF